MTSHIRAISRGKFILGSFEETKWELVNRVPGTRQHKARFWAQKEYIAFAHDNMRFIFLGIAHFSHINRPIDGYYFEFGSHEGRTMSLG